MECPDVIIPEVTTPSTTPRPTTLPPTGRPGDIGASGEQVPLQLTCVILWLYISTTYHNILVILVTATGNLT